MSRLRHVLPLLLLACSLLASCESVPITGRSRTRFLISDAQEIRMGLEAYPQLVSQYKEIKSGRDYAMVQRVMRKLIPFADKLTRSPYKWEVKLLDAPKTLNAWCLPGGKMAVYTGILPICKNESGVAAVMGHEIAHAIANHGAERMTQESLLKAGMVGASLALGSDDPKKRETNAAILTALGLGAKYGLLLPYSRTHESEADEIGLHLLIQAGYDPTESVRLWQRMAKLGGKTPEFLSTHPAPENRAARLRELIPIVRKKYGK